MGVSECLGDAEISTHVQIRPVVVCDNISALLDN